MEAAAKFKAIYASGIFIPDDSIVTALSLLFEKIYLPNNIEFAIEFARKFKFNSKPKLQFDFGNNIRPDPFIKLTKEQHSTALSYLKCGIDFRIHYSLLFKDIFESDLFGDEPPVKVVVVPHDEKIDFKEKDLSSLKFGEKLKPDSLKIGEECELVLFPQPLKFLVGDSKQFYDKINEGYLPVVAKLSPYDKSSKKFDKLTAKHLAALLAMKSVKMILPQTKAVDQLTILEARHRLADHLPPFWSSMLKLSRDLRKLSKNCSTIDELIFEADYIVDTVVRPVLIDLKNKIMKERKNWFFKILSPVQKGLKLMIGNPPITIQQLMTNALLLGSDVSMKIVENMHSIDLLKNQSGITFLLEAEKILNIDTSDHDKHIFIT